MDAGRLPLAKNYFTKVKFLTITLKQLVNYQKLSSHFPLTPIHQHLSGELVCTLLDEERHAFWLC